VPLPFERFIRRVSPLIKYLRPFARPWPSGSAVSVDPAFVISHRMVVESTHSSVNVTGGDSGNCIGIDMAVTRTGEYGESTDTRISTTTIATGRSAVGGFRSMAD